MVREAVMSGILGGAAVYMLYKNIWFALIGATVGAVYSILCKKGRERHRVIKLQLRYLDFLLCLEPLLKTSGTFFQAFKDASADYKRFHGKDYISNCLDGALNDFRMNDPTRVVLEKFADKLKFEDADAFAKSMAVCEETGGNPVEIISRTTELLVAKIRVISDIETMLSGKVFERKVITLMPFVLLGLFSLTSDSYLEPLYITSAGRIVMSVAGLLFIMQWIIGKRMTDIKV